MKKLIDCLKVGDKVFDILEGWGVVDCIIQNPPQITVEFERNEYSTEDFIHYNFEGNRLYTNQKNPSLFLHEIKLEQELPEFMEGDIVLANYGYQDSDWFVAKYIKKFESGYAVNRFELNDDKISHATYVKSFDKSHFESK
jgi:hypothetical protein